MKDTKFGKGRWFVAVPAGKEVQEKVGRLENKLRKKFRWPIKWELPEKLHLTMAFLGNIEEEQIVKVKSLVEEINEKEGLVDGDWRLESRNIGYWKKFRADTMIFLRLRGDVKRLISLRRKLRDELRGLGLEIPGEFDPHLTIGRIKWRDRYQVGDLTELERFKVGEIGSFAVKLELRESRYDKEKDTTVYFRW